MGDKPTVTRVYQNAMLDSTYWELYKPRPNDIVISTSMQVTHNIWKDPKKFFHKGTNGRWRDVLTQDDLALYEDLNSRALSPDAARWLEEGSLSAGYPWRSSSGLSARE